MTVGQRRGLGVAAGERLFVVGIDGPSRRVTVAPRRAATCGAAVLADATWLAAPASGQPVEVKHRANEPAVPACVSIDATGAAQVRFAEPQVGVAPGQACVVYAGSRVLGGGWIAVAPLLAAA